MKYIFFVSREPWASFNSIYAYATMHGFPANLIAFYSDEKNMKKVEKMLEILYGDKNINMKKVKIPEDGVELMRKIVEDYVEEGDIIDITGARKFTILSLLGLKGVRVVYLFLQDMRFSSLPFMMRPLSVQSLMEVEI